MSQTASPAFSLAGRAALITGAARGMGFGIARAMAAQGATVIINDIDKALADAAAQDLKQQGYSVSALAFDITDNAAVCNALATIPVDILVNNAGKAGDGMMQQKNFADSSVQDWQPYVDSNLYGMLNCSHAVLAGMQARRFGRIITISSEAGRRGLNIGVSIYGAAKAAQISFMRHLSQEVARDGITCNSVALGLMNNVPDEFAAPMARGIPVGRLGTPQDAGSACVFLASKEAEWITGQCLAVNGGVSAF
jgi:NAD(P)-dependent dehydrogenase (short-subunit alcohol dehydrogenase family)